MKISVKAIKISLLIIIISVALIIDSAIRKKSQITYSIGDYYTKLATNYIEKGKEITTANEEVIKRSLIKLWKNKKLREKYLRPYDVYVALRFPLGVIIDKDSAKSMINYFEKKYNYTNINKNPEIVGVPYLLYMAEKRGILENRSFHALFKITEEWLNKYLKEEKSPDTFIAEVAFLETIKNTKFMNKETKENYLKKYCNKIREEEKDLAHHISVKKMNKTDLLLDYRPKIIYQKICKLGLTKADYMNLEYIIKEYPEIKEFFLPFIKNNSSVDLIT